MNRGSAAPRLNNFHGHKKQLIGNHAGQVPPAWRNTDSGGNASGSGAKGKHVQLGSKILLSQLPPDVLEKEVEELFQKTVGPVGKCFMIFNSQGRSKGMAVVEFTRPGDAALARTKYNGKVVDGRKGLKIEIIVDANSVTTTSTPAQPTLLSRLQPESMQSRITKAAPAASSSAPQPQMNAASSANNHAPAPAARRVRYKKGPRRLNKRQQTRAVGDGRPAPVTRDQLDKEMDEWRAASD